MTTNKKLLIVDDDQRNIFALKAVLRAKGYECVSVSGGREAIALLKQDHDIDAVLLDMMMPEMDGYETISVIRSMPDIAHSCIISVTAQAMKGDREKCLAAGADAYVSKPINVDMLVSVLQECTK